MGQSTAARSGVRDPHPGVRDLHPGVRELRERLAALQPGSAALAAGTPMGCYLHIPFCTVRCGYCDFNTYVASSLGPNAAADFLAAAHSEIELAAGLLAGRVPPLETVFFGGGTPTLLSAAQLGGLLDHLRATFGLAAGAEISTEANPETLGPAELDALRAAGINRLSLGMQSAVPAVLATLDRVHTPGRTLQVIDEARGAGFDQVSLDLIYGTPGETLADWRTSLDAALSATPQHISAYALVIEPATAMGRRLAAGRIAPVDPDLQADMYLLADQTLTGAGYHNYEVSNWADEPAHRARHNLGYWRGHNWWGIGPGAHSHVAGNRWWNVKHPGRYAGLLAAGDLPVDDHEWLDAPTRRIERVLLELRLAEGLPVDVLTATEAARLPGLAERGLLVLADRSVRLTRQGRLLADAVIRDLLD